MLITGRSTGRYLIITILLLTVNYLQATEPLFPVIDAGQNADGRLEIFYIDTNHICFHRWQMSPGGEWSEEMPCFDSAKTVAVGRDLDSCLNVFIIGQGNRLFLKKQSSPSNGWLEPVEMDSQVNAMYLFCDDSGYLHLFNTGLDNILYYRRQALSDREWSEKSNLADYASAFSAGQNQDGRLEVFYSGTGNALFHRWQLTPDGTWSDENPFADSARHIAVSRNNDGRLEVFFVNNDNILNHRWQIAPNSGWDDHAVFAGPAKFVTVENNYDGRMEVFYTDLDNIIHHRWQFAPSSGWEEGKQYGWSAKSIAAIQNHNGCLETFYLDTNNILFHNWQLNPGYHWAGEYLMVLPDPPLFSVDQFPDDPIYKTSHDNWHVNDHCFIRGKDGTWHMYGIIWPDPGSGDPTIANYFGHAAADDPDQESWEELEPPFYEESYIDGKVLWAPHVIQHEDSFYMFYCGGGPVESYAIVLRTSSDLEVWSDPRILFRDGFQARDPMVIWCAGENMWVMYYTATTFPEGGHHVVAYRTSEDLVHWSGREIAYTDFHEGTGYGPTESPFVVQRGDYYYLFIGPRPFDQPTDTLHEWEHPGYDGTDVFRSDSWDQWENTDYVGHIPVHAPEIIRDENHNWYISRAGILRGGLYLTKMTWLDGLETKVKDIKYGEQAANEDIQLLQNYPNPFIRQTCLNFTITDHEHIIIRVTDITGRQVKVLMNEELAAGTYEVTWDGTDYSKNKVSPGTYFCNIYTKSTTAVVKMILH